MKYLAALLFSTILFSCKEPGRLEHEETPATAKVIEAFEDASGSSDYSSFKTRRSTNIIDALYKEAKDANQELKQLDKSFEKLYEMYRDSIQYYQEVIGNTEDYWNSVDIRITSITDTILRAETKAKYTALKEEGYAEYQGLFESINKIRSTMSQLDDQQILLRLSVSHQMIAEYMKDSKPRQQSLDYILKAYNEKLKETKEFIENLE